MITRAKAAPGQSRYADLDGLDQDGGRMTMVLTVPLPHTVAVNKVRPSAEHDGSQLSGPAPIFQQDSAFRDRWLDQGQRPVVRVHVCADADGQRQVRRGVTEVDLCAAWLTTDHLKR